MDKYKLINQMIYALDHIPITGVRPMAVIIETVKKLDTLKKILEEEDNRGGDDNDQQGENI